jgi:biotin---protein ligase
MASKRLNILVYSGGQSKDSWWANENLLTSTGNGSTVESVRHCLYTLRRLLGPNYAVIPVTGDMLIKEPWTANCAALVFPGGADQGYCRTLDGEGNRRIKRYVEGGGVYIGFCAGGYYGSKRCEFEVGSKPMEVVGERELAFFPGIARGCAFPGFVYHSEKGARAAELKVDKSILSAGSVPNLFKSYYNGGGTFVDASRFKDEGVEVLASYTEDLAVDSGEGSAAIVYCRVGKGAAMLTGPHPEFVSLGKPVDDWSLTKPRFATVNLNEKSIVPGFSEVIKTLANDEKHRMDFLKSCLIKLGLQISEEQDVPSLSRMHLSSQSPAGATGIISTLEGVITKDVHGERLLKDDNDTFHIVEPSTWRMVDLVEALPTEDHPIESSDQVDGAAGDQILDYNTIVKQILVHEDDYPDAKQTPYFNHNAFYANLKYYQSISSESSSTFGSNMLYGEVVTSTNTILEKNTKLLRNLPTGFTATATQQVAGRGRGSNVWVSPAGQLIFSTVIRHPMASMQSAPVVFVQYLAGMAIVAGIKTYEGSQYKDMPVKLKWPNDIYALDPVKAAEGGGDKHENYSKIGGILVNSHYNTEDYIAVCGCGINTANAAPTTSLNQLIPHLPRKGLQPFTLEKLLARILTVFEDLYTHFLRSGFDKHLEEMYYQQWLHMNQIVTLETEGGARAKIKGVTRDYGLLIAEELGWEDRPTGKTFTLMSDSNSFDFFKGLLKRKV